MTVNAVNITSHQPIKIYAVWKIQIINTQAGERVNCLLSILNRARDDRSVGKKRNSTNLCWNWNEIMMWYNNCLRQSVVSTARMLIPIKFIITPIDHELISMKLKVKEHNKTAWVPNWFDYFKSQKGREL